MSAPALIAFYYVTAIESWTYINIIEYYHAKIEQKDLKQILDCVKSLMTGSDELLVQCLVQAGTASLTNLKYAHVNIQHLQMASNLKIHKTKKNTELHFHCLGEATDVDNIEEIMDTKSAKILMMKKNKVGNKEKLNKEANDYPGSFATTFTVDSDINNINIECTVYNDDLPLSNEIQLPIENANNDRHSEELLDPGILDLTRENLNDFEIKDEVIRKLSQDFSNKITCLG
ncbi:12963_t:CDS:2 [Entrophospora sp. SA101]|nr:12963_t:CDS:2 [Entrophospora sp. SA101]